ncbi:MAG: tetratricopeptide repeat protein [Candidatus Competibacteraceae bacterium]
MGWVQYRLGNHKEALEYLHRAYELNQDPEIAAHLTEVLWVVGQQQEAKDVFQKPWRAIPIASTCLSSRNGSICDKGS